MGEQPTGKGYSVTKSVELDLDYNEYYAIGSKNIISTEGAINWEFLSTNPSVGITVRILDPENYQNLRDGLTYTGVLVCDEVALLDSGTWKPSEGNSYYVVYFNDDSVAQTTSMAMSVEFEYGYWPTWIIALIIAIPSVILVGIISVIIFIVVRKRKKQPTHDYGYEPQPDHSPSAGPSPRKPAEENMLFCNNCGTKNDRTSTFCSDCGKPLK